MGNRGNRREWDGQAGNLRGKGKRGKRDYGYWADLKEQDKLTCNLCDKKDSRRN
jgi:hypothetical protein